MIQGGLRTLLLAQPAITAIVGTSGVYIGTRPQQGASAPRKAVVITVTAEEVNSDIGGGSNLLLFADVDFDCYGPTDYDAANLAKTVREFIDDYSGAAGSETVRAVNVDSGQAHDYIPTASGESGDHVYTVSTQVQYNPA